MLGHEQYVREIALSPVGRRLASAGYDGTVRVWDLNTRRQLGNSLQAQGTRLFTSVSWSPNGRSVIGGDVGGNINLWDIPPLRNSDNVTPPVLDAGSNPLPGTSQSRANSVSSSLLDLPAGAPPSIQPKSHHPPHPDDFWDFPDSDLPTLARPQISTIPITEVPLKPSMPKATKAKTAPNVASASLPSCGNILSRIGARFRCDKNAPETLEVQPPPPKMPKYSPVAKVALGQADALYMDTSKDKKPGDDESGKEEWADVERLRVMMSPGVLRLELEVNNELISVFGII
ncbi:hypothetical protein BJ138DRAFT_1120952 [Hygrophoropsis aurantiaca]|uniref:Uncharacterized protein n=1 Tax=Hygrophoropsis aurantiaca TaxID=72124 RepID=A0ACB7ZPT9_9AGAM|nr:hypothetical protein BJ138DRAFT_1120952 [Hygrophoropsis aurantiaca]